LFNEELTQCYEEVIEVIRKCLFHSKLIVNSTTFVLI